MSEKAGTSFPPLSFWRALGAPAGLRPLPHVREAHKGHLMVIHYVLAAVKAKGLHR